MGGQTLMAKTFYTLWKGYEDINKSDEAILLDSEPIFHTKHRAFKRAHELAKNLVYGWDQAILVRKIRTDTDVCTEWVFAAE